ncbi:MAG: hypothetical protein J6X70_04545 [Muribaculaceae bacterium]|nr:hypothetical protein [Muribaculaceae bacterium]
MKKFILLFLLAAVSTTTIMATGRRSDWVSKMRDTRHDFIIEKINVSASQKKEFLPLYEAMEDEIYNVHKAARDQAKKVETMSNPTDADYQRAAEAMSNVKFREGEIEKSYYEKFAKILSKKQLFLLKQAEAEFTRNMVKKNK